jgi:hypothetical protein
MRAAWIYAGLTVVVCLFHLSLILGAPLGHLTMGGRWSGALPLEGRITSAVSVLILTGLAVVVLARAGILRLTLPRWAIWTVVAYAAVGVVLHVITPSAAERALWLPQIAVMLACAVVVARR